MSTLKKVETQPTQGSMWTFRGRFRTSFWFPPPIQRQQVTSFPPLFWLSLHFPCSGWESRMVQGGWGWALQPSKQALFPMVLRVGGAQCTCSNTPANPRTLSTRLSFLFPCPPSWIVSPTWNDSQTTPLLPCSAERAFLYLLHPIAWDLPWPIKCGESHTGRIPRAWPLEALQQPPCSPRTLTPPPGPPRRMKGHVFITKNRVNP